MPSAKSERSRIGRNVTDQADGTGRVPATIRGIELLQERCTALISAAVTGRIDVRKFAS